MPDGYGVQGILVWKTQSTVVMGKKIKRQRRNPLPTPLRHLDKHDAAVEVFPVANLSDGGKLGADPSIKISIGCSLDRTEYIRTQINTPQL